MQEMLNKRMVEVVFAFVHFYPPTEKFRGYSDERGVRPSVSVRAVTSLRGEGF